MSVRVSVDRLSKRHGNVDALRDVSLDIAPGECLALVGESGSGKTTLLRCVNRLIEPDSGSVLLDGEPVDGRDPVLLRRSIGYVPQEGGLLPHWRVARNVALVPWLDGRADETVTARAMTLAGLDSKTFSRRWPHELSGGQRQRVAIARALLNDPALILADEPTGNLDSRSTAEILAIFQRLNDAGKTVVMVTHEPDVAEHCKRIVRMRDGVVSGDEIVAHPRRADTELQTAGMTGSVDLHPARVAAR